MFMKIRSSLIAVLFPFACLSPVLAQPAQIQINASHVTNSISPYLGTGACLEDVNHEVYGGIYSQMIFGESFQEPAAAPPIRGFTGYGGHWQVNEGVVSVDRGPGPKLIADGIDLLSGEVGVEVFLPGKSHGVAG